MSAAMTEFKVGDVVILLSGGPRMTVERILDAGLVEVGWFDPWAPIFSRQHHTEALDTRTLRRVR